MSDPDEHYDDALANDSDREPDEEPWDEEGEYWGMDD